MKVSKVLTRLLVRTPLLFLVLQIVIDLVCYLPQRGVGQHLLLIVLQTLCPQRESVFSDRRGQATAIVPELCPLDLRVSDNQTS